MNEPGACSVPINLNQLQEEFSDPSSTSSAHPSSTHPSSAPNPSSSDDEVFLLDGKTSLAMNLWLARMEGSVDGLVEALLEGDCMEFNVDSLRQLIKAMPAELEVCAT